MPAWNPLCFHVQLLPLLCGVFYPDQLSSAVVNGGDCRPAQAHHRGGFSSYRAWALGPTGFRVAGSWWERKHRLNSCGTHDVQSIWDLPDQDQPVSPSHNDSHTKPPGKPFSLSLATGSPLPLPNSEEWPDKQRTQRYEAFHVLFHYFLNLLLIEQLKSCGWAVFRCAI